jgi:hypothetical protein
LEEASESYFCYTQGERRNVLHTLFKTLINESFYSGGDSNIPLLSIHDVANDLVPDGSHGTAGHVHVSY